MYSQEERWLLTEKYGGRECEAFAADCQRLKNGEPLAYVIGHVPFLDCTIHLDSRPLIPRPETEFWAEQAMAAIAARAAKSPAISPRVLDLCAGSGAVGVAIAKALPETRVDFAELDAAHLSTIKTNLTANVPDLDTRQTRTNLYESDLFSQITDTYDYILCNPPYIDPALDRTQLSVKAHEPTMALYGGPHGTQYLERIVVAAPRYLNPGGELWLEHEPEQTADLHALAAHHPFTITTHHDQYGVDRYSILTAHY